MFWSKGSCFMEYNQSEGYRELLERGREPMEGWQWNGHLETRCSSWTYSQYGSQYGPIHCHHIIFGKLALLALLFLSLARHPAAFWLTDVRMEATWEPAISISGMSLPGNRLWCRKLNEGPRGWLLGSSACCASLSNRVQILSIHEQGSCGSVHLHPWNWVGWITWRY